MTVMMSTARQINQPFESGLISATRLSNLSFNFLNMAAVEWRLDYSGGSGSWRWEALKIDDNVNYVKL